MNTQKARLFQKIEIGVASPKQIRGWAERFLPNGDKVGEVTSWETVNYKTLKPEPNGLFCQKIFGPVVDFTCACGKKSTKISRKNTVFGRGFCPKCGVERTHSRVRRSRLGYIKLKQPVVHPLYASQRPSPLALCLNWQTKRLQAVTRTVEFCYLPQLFTIFRSHIDSVPFFQKKGDSQLLGKNTPQFFLNIAKPINVCSPNSNLGDTDRLQNSSFYPVPQNEVLVENVVLGKEGGEFFFFEKQAKQKKTTKPRLFAKRNQKTKPIFLFNQGACEARLYGIAYDATWRQVEEFQEFLFYLWDQSFYYESSIPYYAFVKPVKNHSEEIPRHEQSYAIQTGGFALQQILSHLDVGAVQQEIAGHSVHCKFVMHLIQERIAVLDFSSYDDRKEFKRLRIKLNRLQQLQFQWKRQLETFRDFERGKMQPAWMILSYLPVLPPGVRPITSIRGELVVSDINSLYRKVLIRNKRINRGANFGIFDTALAGSWLSWCYNVRQVQEAVDELLKTGSVESGKPLKSLLEGLKGKQGRFRQHLLGKRVDYSGRSVIVVGPELKLHQCGLPKQMAVELFQPFIIQKLRKKGIVFTTTAAKALIAERKPIVWLILGEILRTHPVLLNRAPTLHRLGIQAFLPQLVEGKAILLHPLVCPAFNADFDGDQMAVHVPLSAKTRAEALNLLWAKNHLLAPASGQPLLLPTQDMVLGFYYLTCSLEKSINPLESQISSRTALLKNQSIWSLLPKTNNCSPSPKQCFGEKYNFGEPKGSEKTSFFGEDSFFLRKKDKKNLAFFNFYQVKAAYDRGVVTLHTPIWVRWSGFVETFVPEYDSRAKDNVLETRLDLYGRRESLFLDNCQLFQKTTFVPLPEKEFFEENVSLEKESNFDSSSTNKKVLGADLFSNCEYQQAFRKTAHFVRTTPGRVFMHSWIFQVN